MKHIIKITALSIAALIFVEAASAQTLGIGVRKRGAVNQMGVTVAKVVSKGAGFQLRTVPMAGVQQYVAAINAGKLEFGVVSSMQMAMSVTGTGVAKGKKFPNLRIVSTLVPFESGIMVRNDSPIKTLEQMKGSKYPFGFRSGPLFQFFMEAFLANGGLTWDDVKKVPAVGLRQSVTAFSQGKIDVVPAAAASPFNHELNAKIKGGVRMLSLNDTREGRAALRKYLPRTYIQTLQPSKKLAGIVGPTNVVAYDYTVNAGAHVSNDTAYRVAKAIYDARGELRDSHPIWRKFKANTIAKNLDLPYHPGAIKFYKEVGIWKR